METQQFSLNHKRWGLIGVVAQASRTEFHMFIPSLALLKIILGREVTDTEVQERAKTDPRFAAVCNLPPLAIAPNLGPMCDTKKMVELCKRFLGDSEGKKAFCSVSKAIIANAFYRSPAFREMVKTQYEASMLQNLFNF